MLAFDENAISAAQLIPRRGKLVFSNLVLPLLYCRPYLENPAVPSPTFPSGLPKRSQGRHLGG
jgi:hypothetical protein